MSFFKINNYFPQEIIFGPASISKIGAEYLDLGSKNVLIITDQGLLATGIVDRVTRFLKRADVYSKLSGEPTSDAVEDALRFSKQKDYDLVIGIGGGSAMDTAKVVATLNKQSLTVTDAFGRDLVGARKVGLGLIPTTAGTGSEATPNSIFIDSRDGVKQAVISRELIPDWVVLDPDLTVTLPPAITASTGMDALCHCIESLLSVNSSDISAAYSYHGVKLLCGNIRRVVCRGDDVEARGKMLLGSFFGGLALTLAGTTAVHALSYPLGKRGVPHGIANGMLLPKVLEYNLPYCKEKLDSLAPYIKCDKPLKGAADVVECVAMYLEQFPIPKSLDEVGIGEDTIPELAKEALLQKRLLNNNPIRLSLEEILKIYKAILRY